ncbi:MAG: ATPase, T2SS/T4P/T4SS family [Saccharofermentanales bacterium]
MPLVSSYFKLAELYGSNDTKAMQSGQGDLSALVSAIAIDILTKDPMLVADVVSGKTGKGILENAITHSTENNRQSFGFYQDELLKRVLDFMFGYGPLQDYIEQDDITDIDGTRFNEFSVKINGIRTTVPIAFQDSQTFDTYCRLIIIRNGGVINENDSHCRVVDEQKRLRINVSVPPRNITGPSISIRKHKKDCYSLDDLAGMGMLSSENKEILEQLAKEDASVLFCGKGASGKTTLLRAFINVLPLMERVLVVESDSEIYPSKPYCIAQRIKKANEGGRTVTLKELVADGLTMSLDTYCVGEIVGNEAWEFIRAAFSGHKCLATTHSESAADSMDRILTLARPGSFGESENVLKRMIGRGIDIIVYLRNFRVIEIMRINGYNGERNDYDTEVLWK